MSTIFDCIAQNKIYKLKKLLKQISNIDKPFKQTALHFACENNPNEDIIKLLISAGANVNAKTNYSPLHYACFKKAPIEVIRFLLVSGANINSKNKWNPLQIAIKSKADPKLIKLLLEAGSFVNNKDNQTPLHDACENNYEKSIIKILIAAGADVFAINKCTPIDLAKNKEVRKTLREFQPIIREMRKFCKKRELTDFTINCKDGKISVHYLLLKIRIGKEKIGKMNGIFAQKTKEEVEEILEFIYSGYVPENQEKIEEFCEKMEINFEEKKGSKGILKDLKELYLDEETKDFSIVEPKTGNKIKVHKLILMARTKLFYNMFSVVKDESGQVNDYCGRSTQSISAFVRYLYSDDFPQDVSYDTFYHLKDAFDYFELYKYSSFNYRLAHSVVDSSNLISFL
ncbi:ankyrin repeat-containing protein [Anaeramoeba ignava]|uniref:Ankyrin repeat-containing protein n=1 Tax=Anaeramoeba ignava TaxID=1746090 RepID=A0A9Q0LGR8_ANAIG|nr:ankyrin repeat-containing protein [Anaeramoeba ignava]